MLQGILPVLPTLFDDQNAIDTEALRHVVRFALNAGAHGVVFPGVASEYNFLSVQERGELMAAVHDEVNGRVPIVGGASAPTSAEVIVAAQQATEHGIHHLMIMAPSRLGSDVDAHQRFFSEITSAVPKIEILLQNAPSPIGAGLAPDAITKIVAENCSITYAKEETLPSGPAITAIRNAGIAHLKGVMGGGGARYIVDEFCRGAIGAIPAVELTDLHVAIFSALAGGQTARARELYRLSLPLLVSQLIYRMRLTKYVLKKRQVVDRTYVRSPLPEFDEFTRRDIDQMLDDLAKDFDLVGMTG